LSTFRNILVYAETPDAACFEQVVEFAVHHGATLSVCDVIEPAPGFDPDGVASRLKSLAWSLTFERLRALCAPHASRMALDYAVLTGNPFLAVTEQVIKQHFDLVVHISEAAPDAPGAALNPTGMHLVRKCPCAVWALHPQREARSRSILLAVDRDRAAGGVADAFALELAATAATLAEARGAKLHLVHAWSAYGEVLLRHPRAALADAEIERYLQAQSEDHAAWFADFARRAAGSGARVEIEEHLLRGSPVQVIPELARTLQAALVVMGTIGTSSLPGVLIGTTAEAVLSAAETPVLALKPRGFTSPIQFTDAGGRSAA
jgi:nucleotide-binding universal stress UspA family protein